ncbi:MAG: efflux RND transporter periplasmic adaptor subunit [Candidatus Competibacteraceae bacterium]
MQLYPMLLLLLGSLLPAGSHGDTPPVPMAVVETRSLPQEQILDGLVEAVNRSTVSAQTAGRVKEILVDVNDTVEQGAPIIRLRDTEQRAGLEQAQAALKEAQARFLEAQAEYNRIKDLYDKKLVAKAQLDTITATQDAAKARLDATQAGVTEAQEQLDNTVIYAPYSGVVLERHIQLGEAVRPGTPLMTGFSPDHLRVVVNVPQRLIERVRQYHQAGVLLPTGRVAAEKLTFFPYADPASNVFKVRVYLPEKIKGVYPGMFVKTAFVIGAVERLVVPQAAVAYRGEMTGVYVLKDNRISLHQVRVGRVVRGDQIEVLAGLEAGEQVALDPIRAGIDLKEKPAER